MKSLIAPLAVGFVFLVQTSVSFAMSQTVSTLRVGTAPECKKDRLDPFDVGVRGKRGLDQGKCLDFAYRPVVILTASEIAMHKIPVKPNHIAIANVAHRNTHSDGFYIASVPVNAAYETRFLLEHFIIGKNTPMPIDPGHTMVRVLFNSDVQIFEQRAGKTGLAYTTRELIFSIQSSGKFEANPELITRVIDGSFAIVGSVFTFPAKFQKHTGPNGLQVEQWKLTLSPAETSAFVKNYIEKANRDVAKHSYLLGTANCVTELFRIFDKMFTYSNSQLNNIANARDGEWIPSESPRALEARSLIKGDSKMPDVNAEL
jgi:hypothetical protein